MSTLATTRLKPKPLTAADFAPYGNVIEVSDKANHFTINNGFTERYHDLASVDVTHSGGQAAISIFRSSPVTGNLLIKQMERHPLSSQAFMPLSNNPYLVVVAQAGTFKPENIEVFLAHATQGVNYHAGTWHHFSLALNSRSDFLVIDRVGEGDNCDDVFLDPPISVTLDEL